MDPDFDDDESDLEVDESDFVSDFDEDESALASDVDVSVELVLELDDLPGRLSFL